MAYTLVENNLYACPKVGYARNRSRTACFYEGFLKQAILGSKRLAGKQVDSFVCYESATQAQRACQVQNYTVYHPTKQCRAFELYCLLLNYIVIALQELNGSKIKVSLKKDKPKRIKLFRLESSAREHTFPIEVEGDTQQISVYDYYRTMPKVIDSCMTL